jgi:hypothetical protein
MFIHFEFENYKNKFKAYCASTQLIIINCKAVAVGLAHHHTKVYGINVRLIFILKVQHHDKLYGLS